MTEGPGIFRNALSIQFDDVGSFPEQTIHFRLTGEGGEVIVRVTGHAIGTGAVASLRLNLAPDQADALEDYLGEMRRIR